jgi:dynein assembly factor 3
MTTQTYARELEINLKNARLIISTFFLINTIIKLKKYNFSLFILRVEMDGLGNINWWGFSPSIDLLKLYFDKELSESHQEKSIELENDDETLNILLVSAGDQRHLLNTIAYRKLYPNKKKICFYVYEKMLELYVRDYLLLSLAIEHPNKRSTQEKTEFFLEIYANLLVRETTTELIQSKANEFIKHITDLESMSKSDSSLFDFSLLKYKERDFIEGILKYWRLKNQIDQKEVFPAQKCWDVRLRNYFEQRFDSRSNAYDWDFSMKLMERNNASIINNKIYSKWRETGVAYELRDSEYNQPNKTLASGAILNDPRNGDKTARRGYFGDIVVGPFLAYGIESENKEFFKKQNDIYRHTSLDIARHNVSQMIDSLMASIEYGETLSEKVTIDNCKIVFMPLTAVQDLIEKPKYERFFDIVYFSNSGASHMSQQMGKVFKSNGLVVFETCKYMIEMKNEQISGFSERIKQLAQECGLQSLQDQIELDKQNEYKYEPYNFYLFKKR